MKRSIIILAAIILIAITAGSGNVLQPLTDTPILLKMGAVSADNIDSAIYEYTHKEYFKVQYHINKEWYKEQIIDSNQSTKETE